MTQSYNTPYNPHNHQGNNNEDDVFARLDVDVYDTIATPPATTTNDALINHSNQTTNFTVGTTNAETNYVVATNTSIVPSTSSSTWTPIASNTEEPEKSTPPSTPLATATAAPSPPTPTLNNEKKNGHQTSQEYFDEDPLARKLRRLKRRQKRVYLSGAGGSIVGGIVIGPPGLVLGAIIGGLIANRVSKRKERRKDQRMEREIATFMQHNSNHSSYGGDKGQSMNYPDHQMSMYNAHVYDK